jgi:hypothetical protein
MICAGTVIGKLFEKVLLNRLGCNEYVDLLAYEQAGFRMGFSALEQVFTLRELIQSNRKQRAYCAFIDFRKAYDSIWRDGLWKVLRRAGIGGQMMSVIRGLYANVTGYVKVNGQRSPAFTVRTGVKQGSVLSPLLFNIFINIFIESIRSESGCIQHGSVRVNCLMYADDMALIASTTEELQ